MSGLVLALQAWSIDSGIAHWQTMVFTALTFTQLAHVLVIRSDRESLLTIGIASNLPLLATVVLTVALQFALVYVPALNRIFDTAPLSAFEVALCAACAVVVALAVESEKWLVRRGMIYRTAG